MDAFDCRLPAQIYRQAASMPTVTGGSACASREPRRSRISDLARSSGLIRRSLSRVCPAPTVLCRLRDQRDDGPVAALTSIPMRRDNTVGIPLRRDREAALDLQAGTRPRVVNLAVGLDLRVSVEQTGRRQVEGRRESSVDTFELVQAGQN
jgi:hypothetical protein